MIFSRIFDKLKYLYYRSSSDKYIAYLRKKGMIIGDDVTIMSCSKCHIDEGRAKFIKIGSNVVICTGVTILAHDYSYFVLRSAYNKILPTGGGSVIIGNNVFIGENAMILRNVQIGNNCIIGAGAIVTKNIPDNSVCVGSPAKVIMTLEQYAKKRQDLLLHEAEQNIKDIMYLHNRIPTEDEMANFRILFMPRTESNLNKLKSEKVLGGGDIFKIFEQTAPLFDSYEKMVESFGIKFNK